MEDMTTMNDGPLDVKARAVVRVVVTETTIKAMATTATATTAERKTRSNDLDVARALRATAATTVTEAILIPRARMEAAAMAPDS